jgi:hypothetical protein
MPEAALPLKIVRKFDSSANLVMKSHQENAWRTFHAFSSDFSNAITTLQNQKASPSYPAVRNTINWF